MAKYKIIQDKENCIGCGACSAICPEFWEMDENGLAHLKESIENDGQYELEINTEDERARNQEAVDACPVKVISIKEIK
jgi:ferredoxin